MSRVLFIRSNSVNPDPRVEKSAYTLGKNGYKVKILAWDRSCDNLNHENKTNYEIHRIKLKALYGRPELIIKLVLWNIYQFIYLIRADFDILHVCDLDTLLPAVIISKLKNKKLVYDSFDFYADSLPQNVPNFIRNIIAKIEIFFSQYSDLIIIADESRKEQFENKYLEKMIVINNSPKDSYDKSEIVENSENKVFVLFFSGVINKSRGFYQIIKSIENISDIRLVIAGYNVDSENLTDKIRKIDQVSFLGKISYEEVIKQTFEADLLFALYDPDLPNHKYSSPNKLFEAMMCGKPIIVSDNTTMANIVRENKCGIVVPYNDINSIRKSVIKLIKDEELRKKLEKNGRTAYEIKYSWNIMEKKLVESYQLLIRIG